MVKLISNTQQYVCITVLQKPRKFNVTTSNTDNYDCNEHH